ncbi:RNA polymerase sigma factor [Archangium lansingense]|uniref:Sigma-70 family RNA polymerase sigma factor n=1 Tax=Archangium lansingense TaxID=2995310 RepID=A0ABT4ANU2_9BACT|nr:sigma-70 family RNA polymerase sigma factor [Archangium lansinium]MCY1082941.1 sigma-70 family RNA polymerase sigma factor [Archangium lansinium]
MQLEEREKLEQEIRALSKQGDLAGAVERALEGYGQEIMRLMASVLHDYERSRDAFSLFSENLLRGLSGFRWESSFRTWAYRLARNACYQVMHAPAGREQPMTTSRLPDEAIKMRSETRPWQRTSVKERFRALRESLDPQERMLLLLRVDQRLSWDEVARVMSEGEEELTDAALKRKAAALRQQFQRIKSHLRSLAEEEGLISPDADDSPTHA